MKRYESFVQNVFKGKDKQDIIEREKAKAREKGWKFFTLIKFIFCISISRFCNELF